MKGNGEISQMKLYAVLDTKGDGRLVGVWDSKKIANKLIKRFPAYYKLHIVELNKINRNILRWADNQEQKRFLENMIENYSTPG
jgi:hypothetical protein